MKYDISILIPGIRPHNWKTVYDTVSQSCKKYTWEIVFAGPFAPPAELAGVTNIKYIKTYRCPSSAGQMAVEHCDGRLLLHSVDDSRWVPDAVDLAMGTYAEANDRKAVINMRYTEGDNFVCDTFPPQYWNAYHHPALHAPGVPSHYKIALHFLVDIGYFREMGGFDCHYEYMNFNLHDLMYRIQYDGGVVHFSPTDVTKCDHMSRRGDHLVIEATHDVDMAKYRQKYWNPNALTPETVRIPFDNWRQQPEVWTRRFPRLFETYEEMMRG